MNTTLHRVWLVTFTFGILVNGVATGSEQSQVKLLANSEFDAWRSTDGAAQKGTIQIRDGRIMHLNVKPHQQVGEAAFDDDGGLVLTFSSHRKFGQSKAIVKSVGKGRWEGLMELPNGATSKFVLKRQD